MLGLLVNKSDLISPDAAKDPKGMNFLQRISFKTGRTALQTITPDVPSGLRVSSGPGGYECNGCGEKTGPSVGANDTFGLFCS